MRKLKLKGARHSSNLFAAITHNTGYGSIVEIFDQCGGIDDYCLPMIDSANRCRALSDWLLLAAEQLDKKGQP